MRCDRVEAGYMIRESAAAATTTATAICCHNHYIQRWRWRNLLQ